MTFDSMSSTLDTTFIDDEPIAPGTYVTSSHLDGPPHAHVVTLPTFSTARYGLTLLASRQLRWTATLPKQVSQHVFPIACVRSCSTRPQRSPGRMLTAFSQPMTHALDTSTNSVDSQQSWPSNSFGRQKILMLYKHLSVVEHKPQSSSATSIDQISQPTQALLQALDSV